MSTLLDLATLFIRLFIYYYEYLIYATIFITILLWTIKTKNDKQRLLLFIAFVISLVSISVVSEKSESLYKVVKHINTEEFNVSLASLEERSPNTFAATTPDNAIIVFYLNDKTDEIEYVLIKSRGGII